jgi:hypothetical protein
MIMYFAIEDKNDVSPDNARLIICTDMDTIAEYDEDPDWVVGEVTEKHGAFHIELSLWYSPHGVFKLTINEMGMMQAIRTTLAAVQYHKRTGQ